MSDAAHALRIVVPRYGPDIVGGAESLIRMLAHSLRDAGWSIEVFTTCATDERTWANVTAAGRCQEEGVEVHRFRVAIPRFPRLFHQASRIFYRLPPPMRPEAAWILAQGPYAPRLITALRRGPRIPTVFMPYLFHPTLRGLPATPGIRMLLPAAHDERPLALRAVGATVRAADALLYSTDEEREILEDAHPIAQDRPHAVGTVAVVPPAGVDPVRFRRRHAIEGPYFIYGGRGTPGKGMEQLLDGIARLHAGGHGDAQLVLTGEAGAQLDPQPGVRVLGHLDSADRWDALAGATAAVVPSFHESLSLLALESWSVGRPVLLNAASPVLAGQGARSGGAIAYTGAGELAAAAAQLLSNDGRAAMLGAAGRTYVQTVYRWPAVHHRIVDLITAAGRRRGDP